VLSSASDPFVIQKDTFYYYTHTLGNSIGLWRTNKMTTLPAALFKTVFTPTATGPNSKNIWAPELWFLDNKWYIYYTAGDGSSLATQRTFVLENTNVDPMQGVWTDKGRIFNPSEDFWAIDGTVFSYNANNYFIWSGQPSLSSQQQNIYISRMTNPWTLEGPRVLLTSPQLAWETVGDPDVNEGPETLKNPAGNYFLIYSASGCWTDDYSLGMLSLSAGGDPLNPAAWSKAQAPVFAKNVQSNVYGPGHNSFFKSKDGTEDWIIYHANAQPGNNNGCGPSRSVRMQPFSWNSNGTPNFGSPVAAFSAIPKPKGE
jgi:GH43 family beta-xylosidase